MATPGYMDCDGTGDSGKTSDKAALDLTGDMELIGLAAMDVWATGDDQQPLVCKWEGAGDQRCYEMSIAGNSSIRMRWTDDGTTGTVHTNTSGVLTGIVTDGEHCWIRVTLDADTGGDYLISYYYSLDPIDTAVGDVNWTAHGTDTSSGPDPATPFSGSAPLQVGSLNNRTDQVDAILGKFYAGWLYDGIGGTLVADPDYRDGVQGWASPPGTDNNSNSWEFFADAFWVPPVDDTVNLFVNRRRQRVT